MLSWKVFKKNCIICDFYKKRIFFTLFRLIFIDLQNVGVISAGPCIYIYIYIYIYYTMRSYVRLSNYMHLKYCTVSKNPDPEYYKREVKRRKVEVRKMYNVQYTAGISHRYSHQDNHRITFRIPEREKRSFSSLKRSDQIWVTHSLLLNRHWGLFRGGKGGRDVKLDI